MKIVKEIFCSMKLYETRFFIFMQLHDKLLSMNENKFFLDFVSSETH